MKARALVWVMLLPACGAPEPVTTTTVRAPSAAAAVLSGEQGDPAGEAALADYPTRDEVEAEVEAYGDKLTETSAEALLAAEDLPSQEALDALLREADLAVLETALTEADAALLFVPKDKVPDPALLMAKEDAAATFVLKSTAEDYEALALVTDLPDTSGLLTKDELEATYASASQLTSAHYSKTAANQTFQTKTAPLAPGLVSAVDAAIASALAERSCPDGMLPVGDACVDRFEASAWSDPGCEGTQYGADGKDDYPATFPDSGAFALPVYACSKAGVRPSRSITWFQAQQACAASGKRLCADAEWQTAAAGTPDADSACRIDPFAGTPAVIDASTACTSAWGVADLVGNASEWTASLRVSGKKWVQSTTYALTDAWPAGYGDGQDVTAGVNGYAARETDDGTYSKGLPAAVVRGGSYLDGKAAGVFHMDWTRSPAEALPTLGFRCCATR
jgi:hypothetical protein